MRSPRMGQPRRRGRAGEVEEGCRGGVEPGPAEGMRRVRMREGEQGEGDEGDEGHQRSAAVEGWWNQERPRRESGGCVMGGE